MVSVICELVTLIFENIIIKIHPSLHTARTSHQLVHGYIILFVFALVVTSALIIAMFFMTYKTTYQCMVCVCACVYNEYFYMALCKVVVETQHFLVLVWGVKIAEVNLN